RCREVDAEIVRVAGFPAPNQANVTPLVARTQPDSIGFLSVEEDSHVHFGRRVRSWTNRNPNCAAAGRIEERGLRRRPAVSDSFGILLPARQPNGSAS